MIVANNSERDWGNNDGEEIGHTESGRRADAATRHTIGTSASLDRKELVPLLEQILAQTEFTNALLDQLRGLEEKQARCQRQLKEKQREARTLIAAAEQLRHENAVLRLKVEEHSRDIAAKEAEAQAVRGELNELRQTTLEAREAVQASSRAREHEASKAKSAVVSLEEVKLKLAAAENSAGERLERQRRELEASMAELVSARRELSVARRERDEAVESHLPELRRRLAASSAAEKEAAQTASEATEAANAANVRETRAEGARRHAVCERDEAQRELIESRERLQAAEEVSSRLTAECEVFETELEKREAALLKMSEQNEILEANSERLQSELSVAGRELVTLARKAAAEKKALEARLREAEQQRAKAVAERKQEARDRAFDCAKRAAEEVETRRDAEAAYIKLQADHAELLTALEESRSATVSASHKARDAASRATRLEAKLAHVEATSQCEAQAAKARELELRDLLVAKDADVKAASHTTRQRCEELLADANAKTAAAREACAALVADVADLRKRAGLLRVYSDTCCRQFDQPIAKWHAETADAFTALVDTISEMKHGAKNSAETIEDLAERNRDAEARLAAALDEAERARQERDEHNSDDRLEALQAQLTAAELRRADADDRTKRIQRSLDEAHTRATAAEKRARAVEDDLSETKALLESSNRAVDANRAELQQRLEVALHDADFARAKRADLERQLAQVCAQLANVDHARTQADERIARLDAQRKQQDYDLNAQLKAFNQHMLSSNAQLDSTKKYLSLVQTQRDDLEQENSRLRAELDLLYNKAPSVLRSSANESTGQP